MLRKLFTLIGLSIFLMTNVQAQCEDCNPAEKEADYYYKHPNFEGQCAQFWEKEDYFLINQKKKTLAVEFPAEGEETIPYLMRIANNKKLKLKTIDVLFIQEALETWAVEKNKIGYEVTASGLGVKMINKGQGVLPEKGKVVKVHYQGYLEDGTKFDSSVDRGQPFEFPLGMGRVIKGWDEGIALLNVGSKAMLRIPPELGYGSRPIGPIPANSILYFEVELLGVE
ncbi:FKBP-type peptidyl-prolyl cis-trans isomerase [Limibacter armeniacum]|uniref:FKBP-type peptidyl-prolyl cis-trans isomerase n=1 Tax=Limibacter armeniacum TaxID=466084 RepID=UPI002FE53F75